MSLVFIDTQLKTVCSDIAYGVIDDVSEKDKYIVWFRIQSDLNTNHTSKTRKYRVAYVCKDFVPENAEESIANALEQIPGCKMSGDASYAFATDPTTNITYEVLQMNFSISEKVK